MASFIGRIKNKFSKSSLIAKIIVVAVIVGIGLFIKSRLTANQATTPQYQTEKVSRGTIIQTVSATGQVSSTNSTPVTTNVSGTITKLYVKNGDTVKAGAPIAQLQLDQQSTQKYMQALSSYQSAQNSLVSANTSKITMKSDMITAENAFLKQALDKGLDTTNPTYIQLKANKDSAEAKYNNQGSVINQVQTSLSNASLSLQQVSPTIYAPISGTLYGLSLHVGSVIPNQSATQSQSTQTAQKVASVITSAAPIISSSISEIDITKIKVGQKATITFDALPNKTYTGSVSSIDTAGSVSSGVTTYATTITLDTVSPEIYANMSANANIIIESKDNVLTVPTTAIQSQNGQSVVRTLTNGTVTYVPVETGISSDTSIEIISGVNEGDDVVTSITIPTTTTSTGASPFGIRTGGFGGATGGNVIRRGN